MANPDTAIIDEFSAAVAALASHAPAADVERLARATGNLLESLANRAASQSAGAFVAVYEGLRNDHNNLRTIAQDQATQLINHEQRLFELERQAGA
jgi:S-adenosylmethionine synthetase